MSPPPALRLLFFGTPEFAVPSLRALVCSRHPVVGAISQPDRPRGRGRKLAPTPVKLEAQAHGLAVLQPEKVGESAALDWMRERAPELGVVVAFGQFIPRSVRELPPRGLINAHASLLPRHRGAAPIAHSILAGDRRTGISVIRVVREMDAGEICGVRETEIDPEESAGALAERLAELAAEALLEAVDRIAEGSAEFRPQDPSGVTQAPKLGRDFGRIDWSEPRDRVLRRIRAATPWPGADLELPRGQGRLRILQARAWSEAPAPSAPGRIRIEGERLGVSAADGWIELLRVRKPGGRPLTAAEYLRGARVSADEEGGPA
ncbi:MAG: methionyl-tRNA formyltransferase [Myxococcota bacterium]